MAKHDYPMGTVSHATMCLDDLIPRFIDAARSMQPLRRKHSKIVTAIKGRSAKRGYYESETADWDLEELFDLLDEYAAPYFYFGAHPGDGSDYGFWLREDFDQDFEGLKVDDLSDVPSVYHGEVLVVNDHGNMTLYNRGRNGRLTEIWGIV
jgi:hypothetical protein